MPKKAKIRDVHLRLELDTEELYKDFQLIKKRKAVRNNTDVLRNLITEEAIKIRKEIGEEYDRQTPPAKKEGS